MNKGIGYRFWEWLRSYSNKKVRDCYMEVVHHDRLCERCNTWTSEIGGCTKISHSPCGWFEYMTCKKCHHISTWDCRGMIPTLVRTPHLTPEPHE